MRDYFTSNTATISGIVARGTGYFTTLLRTLNNADAWRVKSPPPPWRMTQRSTERLCDAAVRLSAESSGGSSCGDISGLRGGGAVNAC